VHPRLSNRSTIHVGKQYHQQIALPKCHPAKVNELSIYQSAGKSSFFSPFDITVDPMEALFLNIFADGVDYDGLELQLFDDEEKGRGLAVLMYRTDGKLDFYMTPGLHLNHERAEVGAGVGDWITKEFSSKLLRTTRGVEAEVSLTLKDGRPLYMFVKEQRAKRGHGLTILAPLGSAIEQPIFFPAFLMFDIDLVRQRNTEVEFRIGGTTYPPIKLPMPMPYNRARVYFMRYCMDPLIGLINQVVDGPLPKLNPGNATSCEYEHMQYELLHNAGHVEICKVSALAKERELYLAFDPPLPDLACLAEGIQVNGRFELGVDEIADIVVGHYGVSHQNTKIDLVMQPTEDWRPRGSLLERLTLRFFPPVFRTLGQDISLVGNHRSGSWQVAADAFGVAKD